jgi:hypothetical protein
MAATFLASDLLIIMQMFIFCIMLMFTAAIKIAFTQPSVLNDAELKRYSF